MSSSSIFDCLIDLFTTLCKLRFIINSTNFISRFLIYLLFIFHPRWYLFLKFYDQYSIVSDRRNESNNTQKHVFPTHTQTKTRFSLLSNYQRPLLAEKISRLVPQRFLLLQHGNILRPREQCQSHATREGATPIIRGSSSRNTSYLP